MKMSAGRSTTVAGNATHGLTRITTAILAGGLGTRLRPVVADRPKALAEVRGRPFLSYLLDQVAAAGVQSVVLCIGHLGDQVRNTFGDRYGSLRLQYSREPIPLGTGGALRKAAPLLETEPVLALNGDSFCDLDLNEFLRFHCTARAAGSLALAEMDDTRRYGRVVSQSDGTISEFAEKADTRERGWINAGIYLLSQRLLRSIPEDRPVSLEREVLPLWTGRRLFGYRSEGRFLDIGTPETYAAAEQFFAARRLG